LKPLIIVGALAVLLSGCGIAAKVTARNDMEASKVAYKACLAQHGQDVAACGGCARPTKRTFQPTKRSPESASVVEGGTPAYRTAAYRTARPCARGPGQSVAAYET
jgi:hypothetical protein